ncbi:MAG: hypothetical protein MUD14_00170 [Hydrococcus sp. Prado102]|jgi:hypothetical protein|nr:hypothetical protein [Hydrococcus sp. Prado102]
MTIKELLFQEIESTSEELLEETLDFLRFLKTKNIKAQTHTETDINSSVQSTKHLALQAAAVSDDTNQPIQSTGRSLLEHLKTIGTWEGDDAEECLKRVYSTRGKAQFDEFNPFDE